MERPMIETNPATTFFAGQEIFRYSYAQIKEGATKLYENPANPHAILVLQLFDKDPNLYMPHAVAIFIALESGDLELMDDGTLPSITYVAS